MLNILGFPIHWYPILVVIGILVGGVVAAILAAQKGQQPAHVWWAMAPVCIWSLIGGRLWFVFFPPLSYINNDLTAGWMISHFSDLNIGAIAIWAGGLGLLGALPFGAYALVRYARRHRLPVALWLDIAATALPLAQAIARLGNGLNQDLYGPPTSLPWGMLVSDNSERVAPYTDLAHYPLDSTRFQPVYLYEMILALVVFAVLLIIFTRFYGRWQAGDVALLYVLLYGTGRFLLESMRINISLLGPVNISQVVAGIAALMALGLLIRRHRQVRRVGAEALI